MAREAGLPRPLAPSGVSVLIEPDDEAPLLIGSPVLGDQRGDPSFAIRRGIVIHALLQMLPNLCRRSTCSGGEALSFAGRL